MAKKIYLIAGEASGDLHGANLMRHLKAEAGEPIDIYGVGGDRIRECGALEFFDLAHFHATGITDALKKYPKYRRAAKALLSKIAEVRPDLVILIDNPGFNLHLAEKIHALKIPIVYYIAPQLWAWAPKRIVKIKKYISKVLVVFQFEEKLYRESGIPVVWVGHPLKDLIQPQEDRRSKKSVTPGPSILLLPGSRKGEIQKLLPIFLRAAEKIQQKIPSASFSLLRSPTVPEEFYARFLQKSPWVRLIRDHTYAAIGTSDLALVCSGTATLECALLGIPMIIANKATFITYVIARNVIRVPYLGLPNLLLGDEKFPELLQYEATPEKISGWAVQILTDARLNERMKNDLEEISRKVGGPGAGRRAAQEILKVLPA